MNKTNQLSHRCFVVGLLVASLLAAAALVQPAAGYPTMQIAGSSQGLSNPHQPIFTSHNQKVVENDNGIFCTFNGIVMDRSTNGGQTFTEVYNSGNTNTLKAPTIETDENNNIYLIYPDPSGTATRFQKFTAANGYTSPTINKTFSQATSDSKFSSFYDQGRQRLYHATQHGYFFIFDTSGNFIRGQQLFNTGSTGVGPSYPHLFVDASGVIHYAMTMVDSQAAHPYVGIRYLKSTDGGTNWMTMSNTPVSVPTTSDASGPATTINLSGEEQYQIWLANMHVKNGKVHFFYRMETNLWNYTNAGSPPLIAERQHYMRFDAATGVREIDSGSDFSGGVWQGDTLTVNSTYGCFASDPTNTNSPLFAMFCNGNNNPRTAAAIVSYDNGSTWHDAAISPDESLVADVGGARFSPRYGHVIGTFSGAPGGIWAQPLFFQFSTGVTFYWDCNGTTAGFGTAGGTWGTSADWNTDSGGGSGTFVSTMTTSDTANFGTGATGLAAGTVTVNGTVNSGNITFASGSGAITLTGGTITLPAAATITVNNSSGDTISSTLAGAATALLINGGNNLTISKGTYAGTTTIDNNNVNLGADGALPSGTAVTLQNTGHISMNGHNNTLQSVTFATGNNSIIGSGTLALNNAGATGIYNVSGSNTVSCPIELGSQANSANNLDFGAAAGATLILGGVISSAAGYGMDIYGGTGTVILSAANTYSGLTTISTGNTLQLSGGANRILSGNDIVVGGTVDMNGQAQTLDSVTGSGSITTGGGALTIGSGNSTFAFSGVISETGSLTKIGTGTATLSGANTYSGGTTFTNGYLTANNNAAFGTGPVTISGSANRLVISDGLTVANNITINASASYNSRGLIENSSTGNATLSGGTITINGLTTAGGHLGSLSGSLTINDAINASVTVVHRLGTVIYGGGGAYANLMVRSGTARLGANNGLSTSATVDVANSGTTALDLAGFNQTLTGITRVTAGNTGYITNSSATADSTLTITGTSSYAGNIVDGSAHKVALTVNGGQLTLTGTNTYTSATTVTNGTLLITGSIGSSAVTVKTGGTLGGTGSIGGAVTVQSGGTLSPGAFIGTLSINNRLTLAGTTFVEVNSTNGQSDLVQGVTNLTYGGSLVVSNVAGIQPTNGQTFQLFTVPATRSGNFSSITPALTGGQAWSFNPTNGVLSVLSSIATYPTNISFSVTGGNLSLNWPATHLGWWAQSNSLNVGNPSNWFDISGSSSLTNLNIVPQTSIPNVFYRLRSP